jgi:hypothetical protein
MNLCSAQSLLFVAASCGFLRTGRTETCQKNLLTAPFCPHSTNGKIIFQRSRFQRLPASRWRGWPTSEKKKLLAVPDCLPFPKWFNNSFEFSLHRVACSFSYRRRSYISEGRRTSNTGLLIRMVGQIRSYFSIGVPKSPGVGRNQVIQQKDDYHLGWQSIHRIGDNIQRGSYLDNFSGIILSE